MADIVKIADSNNVQHDINSKMTRGIVRATLDSASTSTNFIATAPNITELYDGLSIIMKNTAVSSASGCTINLNNLGAKNVYNSKTGNSITGGYDSGTEYIFTFDYANDRWIMQCGYYSANSDTIGEYAGRITIDENGYCFTGSILLQTQLNPPRFSAVTTTGGTSTSKNKCDLGFIPNGRVIGSDADANAGANLSEDHAWWTKKLSLRYWTRCSSTTLPSSVIGKSIYLKGTIGTDGKFYIADAPWWAVDLPSEEDEYYYVYIGQMYSRYQYTLAPEHPIYYYDSYLDKIVEYVLDTKSPSAFVDEIRAKDIRVDTGVTMDARNNNVNISAIVGQTTPHLESLINVNSSTEKATLGRALRKWTKIGEVFGATLETAKSITVPYNPYLNPNIPSPTSASEIMVTVEVQVTESYKTYDRWVLPVDQLVNDENSPQDSMQQPNTILLGGFYYSSSYYGTYGVAYERDDFESLGIIFKWSTSWAKAKGQGTIQGNAYRMCIYYR